MNILIYGFGRMGLTHYAILNNILPDAKFTFVDPNKILNFISKKNINGYFVNSDRDLKKPFDLTLITTPPFIHKDLVHNAFSRGDKRIFVEKPFGGHLNFEFDLNSSDIFIGYVLRFNPVVQWVKYNINPNQIAHCYSEYLSNTIENKPKGWRNGQFSGVLNEMGSHILDLNNYLFDIADYKIKSKHIASHISDVDDEVRFHLESNDRDFQFYFNWVDKKIRKPMFKFKLTMRDGGIVEFDQQKIMIKNEEGTSKVLSVVELDQGIPFYLRGVDFTKQMEDLVGKQKKLCKIQEALVINGLMKQILEK